METALARAVQVWAVPAPAARTETALAPAARAEAPDPGTVRHPGAGAASCRAASIAEHPEPPRKRPGFQGPLGRQESGALAAEEECRGRPPGVRTTRSPRDARLQARSLAHLGHQEAAVCREHPEHRAAAEHRTHPAHPGTETNPGHQKPVARPLHPGIPGRRTHSTYPEPRAEAESAHHQERTVRPEAAVLPIPKAPRHPAPTRTGWAHTRPPAHRERVADSSSPPAHRAPPGDPAEAAGSIPRPAPRAKEAPTCSWRHRRCPRRSARAPEHREGRAHPAAEAPRRHHRAPAGNRTRTHPAQTQNQPQPEHQHPADTRTKTHPAQTEAEAGA